MKEPQGRSRAHACETSLADAPLSGKNFVALTIIHAEAVREPDRAVAEFDQTIRDLRTEAIAERDGQRHGLTWMAEVRDDYRRVPAR